MNNGAPQALTIVGSNFSGTSPLIAGPNALTLVATDRAGNISSVTRNVLLDIESPTVAITSPASGAQVNGVVTVAADAADIDSGISSMSLLVDGQVYSTTSSFPYNFELDTISLPAGIHTIMVRATDRAGNQAEASIDIDVLRQIRLQIASPSDGAMLGGAPVLVKGVLNHNLPEVGVVINDMIAQVNEEQFAGEIYLQDGPNIITVTATDGSGLEASASINVTLTPQASMLSLTAIPASGIQPLEVGFEAEASMANPISNYQWDIDGNGTVDSSGATLSSINNTYTNPGLYFPRVIVTDNLGNVYEQITVVNVLSAAYVDALFQAKWEEMRTALTNGDIEGALRLFGSDTQEIYRTQFTALSPILNIIGSELGEIRLIKLEDHRAEYEMTVTRESGTYSYHLLFEMDVNGIWKIRWF